MGWDGYADCDRDRDCLPLDSEIRNDFIAASAEVLELVGSVDGGLSEGWLDCSACRRSLDAGTSLSAHMGNEWTPEELKAAYGESSWPSPSWYSQSARHFMRLCAKHNLGAYFT
jgi:hypothetical protein